MKAKLLMTRNRRGSPSQQRPRTASSQKSRRTGKKSLQGESLARKQSFDERDFLFNLNLNISKLNFKQTQDLAFRNLCGMLKRDALQHIPLVQKTLWKALTVFESNLPWIYLLAWSLQFQQKVAKQLRRQKMELNFAQNQLKILRLYFQYNNQENEKLIGQYLKHLGKCWIQVFETFCQWRRAQKASYQLVVYPLIEVFMKGNLIEQATSDYLIKELFFHFEGNHKKFHWVLQQNLLTLIPKLRQFYPHLNQILNHLALSKTFPLSHDKLVSVCKRYSAYLNSDLKEE